MIDSTSNERTKNNVMRHEYRVLTEAEKLLMQSIKDMGETFLKTLDAHCKPSRETAIAKTKLEEAVMWAVKGITS